MPGRSGMSQPSGQPEGYPYITVTSGMAGFFAVMVWWAPEHGGYEEPYDTGLVRSPVQADAIREAEQWAAAEGVTYRAVEPQPDMVETGETLGDLAKRMGFEIIDTGPR